MSPPHLCSDRDWRTLHKAWQPVFSPSSLTGYLSLMEEAARKLTKRIEAKADGGEARIDIHQELGFMSLQVSNIHPLFSLLPSSAS